MIHSSLKKIREARGLTQAELGAAIGVCTRTIINAEDCNGREPAASTILKLSQFFHLPVEDIFHLDD